MIDPLALAVTALFTLGPTPVTVDRAELVVGGNEAPPPAAVWTPVTLPDRWRQRRFDQAGPGWYRVDLAVSQTGPATWAVYLPDVNMNAAVYLDDALIGVEGAMDGAIGNNWNRPLLFAIPGRQLQPGVHRLLVKVQTRAYAFGGLGPVTVGPYALLAPRYERQRFLSVAVPQIVSCIAALLGLWATGIWFGARRDPLFGWFAAAMLSFVVASLNYHVRDLPIGREAWEWLVNLGPTAFSISTLGFLHRLGGLRRRWMSRAFAAAWALGAIIMAAVPFRWFFEVSHVVYAVGALGGVACVWTALEGRRQLSRFEGAIIIGSMALGTIFGAHDWLVQLGVLGQDSARLLPHAMSAFVLTLGSIVVSRFVRALETARRHNEDLERAVREREAALEQQFARVRAYERAQLLTAERERLMREVHDGLGSHLSAALAMARAPSFSPADVVESLHLISEELALLVDALDPSLDDLPSLLAVVRGRIEPRLARSGVRFEWRVGEVPEDSKLHPEQLHHLLRIVQEAITNVIKHAQARTITVTTAVDNERLMLEIRDDGVGIAPSRGRGRGLANMRQRAHHLGAELTIEPASPGTALVLWLALPRRAAGVSHPS